MKKKNYLAAEATTQEDGSLMHLLNSIRPFCGKNGIEEAVKSSCYLSLSFPVGVWEEIRIVVDNTKVLEATEKFIQRKPKVNVLQNAGICQTTNYLDLFLIMGSFSLFTPISFTNNLDLCGPVTSRPCPGSPPFSPPPPFIPPPTIPTPDGYSATGAIAGGVAAGAALLFAAPALAFAWWRRRKPQKLFFDVSAEEDPEVHLGQLKRFSTGTSSSNR